MRKNLPINLCVLALLTMASISVLAQHRATERTPAEIRNLSGAARRAAVQERKDEVSANSGAGFQGQLHYGPVGTSGEGSFGNRTNFGTVVYDTGNFTNVPNIPAVTDNFSFGNQHDSALGNPLSATPITVTAFQFFMALVNSSSAGTATAFITVFGPLNTAGTNASPLSSVSISAAAGMFNTFTFATPVVVPTTGGAPFSFLAGVWNPTAGPGTPTPCANDCLGFDNSGTVNGQGFHGMAIEDIGGGNFTPIPTANGMLRVSGKNVPVELMDFSIDD